MNRSLTLAVCLSLLGGISSTQAADRNQLVRNDQKDFSTRAKWIYNDLDGGIAEAKRSKRPLMVVFR